MKWLYEACLLLVQALRHPFTYSGHASRREFAQYFIALVLLLVLEFNDLGTVRLMSYIVPAYTSFPEYYLMTIGRGWFLFWALLALTALLGRRLADSGLPSWLSIPFGLPVALAWLGIPFLGLYVQYVALPVMALLILRGLFWRSPDERAARAKQATKAAENTAEGLRRDTNALIQEKGVLERFEQSLTAGDYTAAHNLLLEVGVQPADAYERIQAFRK